jgi:hypothetical protein
MRARRTTERLSLCVLTGCVLVCAAEEQPAKPEEDFFAAIYSDYEPKAFGAFRAKAKLMKLSSEEAFYTLSRVASSSRADALIEAGLKFEDKGDYQKALVVYTQVIDEYPESLYRVNPYGVFVPAALYAQMRMIRFPRNYLDHYAHDSLSAELPGSLQNEAGRPGRGHL